jgi:threonyl-tRNA synthetase
MAPVDREDPSYNLRHSTAYVMAQAVKEMFPEAKLGWGPPHDRFESGFYYDFDLPRALTPEDFPDVDERRERMNAKIRDAQLQKIPYMLVVGNREEEAHGVSVRLRTNENRGMTDLAGFLDHLREVIRMKAVL